LYGKGLGVKHGKNGFHMTELHRALAEISAIRSQVARVTQFRGYGPVSIAASGVLALLVAAVQAKWLSHLTHDYARFIAVWVATAVISVSFTTFETIGRAKRVHSGFAREMIHSAVEQFLPAVVVGLLLTIVLARFASQDSWMLPGLWELIFSLGVFASCRFLPRQMFAVGVWYLVAGFACLVIGSDQRVLSPWAMGIPFGVGQLLVAAVLQFGFKETDEEK
jgi:hypothetical protein